jgi:hypothetical protein
LWSSSNGGYFKNNYWLPNGFHLRGFSDFEAVRFKYWVSESLYLNRATFLILVILMLWWLPLFVYTERAMLLESSAFSSDTSFLDFSLHKSGTLSGSGKPSFLRWFEVAKDVESTSNFWNPRRSIAVNSLPLGQGDIPSFTKASTDQKIMDPNAWLVFTQLEARADFNKNNFFPQITRYFDIFASTTEFNYNKRLSYSDSFGVLRNSRINSEVVSMPNNVASWDFNLFTQTGSFQAASELSNNSLIRNSVDQANKFIDFSEKNTKEDRSVFFNQLLANAYTERFGHTQGVVYTLVPETNFYDFFTTLSDLKTNTTFSNVGAINNLSHLDGYLRNSLVRVYDFKKPLLFKVEPSLHFKNQVSDNLENFEIWHEVNETMWEQVPYAKQVYSKFIKMLFYRVPYAYSVPFLKNMNDRLFMYETLEELLTYMKKKEKVSLSQSWVKDGFKSVHVGPDKNLTCEQYSNLKLLGSPFYTHQAVNPVNYIVYSCNDDSGISFNGVSIGNRLPLEFVRSSSSCDDALGLVKRRFRTLKFSHLVSKLNDKQVTQSSKATKILETWGRGKELSKPAVFWGRRNLVRNVILVDNYTITNTMLITPNNFTQSSWRNSKTLKNNFFFKNNWKDNYLFKLNNTNSTLNNFFKEPFNLYKLLLSPKNSVLDTEGRSIKKHDLKNFVFDEWAHYTKDSKSGECSTSDSQGSSAWPTKLSYNSDFDFNSSLWLNSKKLSFKDWDLYGNGSLNENNNIFTISKNLNTLPNFNFNDTPFLNYEFIDSSKFFNKAKSKELREYTLSGRVTLSDEIDVDGSFINWDPEVPILTGERPKQMYKSFGKIEDAYGEIGEFEEANEALKESNYGSHLSLEETEAPFDNYWMHSFSMPAHVLSVNEQEGLSKYFPKLRLNNFILSPYTAIKGRQAGREVRHRLVPELMNFTNKLNSTQDLLWVQNHSKQEVISLKKNNFTDSLTQSLALSSFKDDYYLEDDYDEDMLWSLDYSSVLGKSTSEDTRFNLNCEKTSLSSASHYLGNYYDHFKKKKLWSLLRLKSIYNYKTTDLLYGSFYFDRDKLSGNNMLSHPYNYSFSINQSIPSYLIYSKDKINQDIAVNFLAKAVDISNLCLNDASKLPEVNKKSLNFNTEEYSLQHTKNFINSAVLVNNYLNMSEVRQNRLSSLLYFIRLSAINSSVNALHLSTEVNKCISLRVSDEFANNFNTHNFNSTFRTYNQYRDKKLLEFANEQSNSDWGVKEKHYVHDENSLLLDYNYSISEANYGYLFRNFNFKTGVNSLLTSEANFINVNNNKKFNMGNFTNLLLASKARSVNAQIRLQGAPLDKGHSTMQKHFYSPRLDYLFFGHKNNFFLQNFKSHNFSFRGKSLITGNVIKELNLVSKIRNSTIRDNKESFSALSKKIIYKFSDIEDLQREKNNSLIGYYKPSYQLNKQKIISLETCKPIHKENTKIYNFLKYNYIWNFFDYEWLAEKVYYFWTTWITWLSKGIITPGWLYKEYGFVFFDWIVNKLEKKWLIYSEYSASDPFWRKMCVKPEDPKNAEISKKEEIKKIRSINYEKIESSQYSKKSKRLLRRSSTNWRSTISERVNWWSKTSNPSTKGFMSIKKKKL